MFSGRLPHRLDENRPTRAVAGLRAARRPVLDLTDANPTSAGLEYPPGLLASLAAPAALAYHPSPFGLPGAREAVAAEFARRGAGVAADRVILTASTSEAYSWLFKLLCDPGDEILVPQPSYPLFEHLSSLDAVRALPYRLEHHEVWSVDRESLLAAWSARTRIVLVVSPNNPTGSLLRAGDLEWLLGECATRGASLVSDEVFADYLFAPAEDGVRSLLAAGPGAPRQAGVLSAVLGGLSKSVGLPQVKVGWMALDGPERLVHAALARLELIADTYLSVGTPAQVALEQLLKDGATVRDAIAARTAANLSTLAATVRRHPACDLLRVEGGWSAVVRVPATRSEDDLVETLLEREGVLVHPGYFFDFPYEAFLVLSLLPPCDAFSRGADAVCRVASS